MFILELNKRKVIDIDIDGIDSTDYPDFCDAYVCSAIYEDTGKELSDDDYEKLNDQYHGEISAEALMISIGAH